VRNSLYQCFPKVLLTDLSWPQNIPTDPHVLSHLTKVPGW